MTPKLNLSSLRDKLQRFTGDPSLLVHPAQSLGADLWVTYECDCGRRKLLEVSDMAKAPVASEADFEGWVADKITGYVAVSIERHARVMHCEPTPEVN